jgi:8-oxo-dGTP pyrophosphatase MutT (NUDIX family)
MSKYSKKNIFCTNCGKYGHNYKMCRFPIISYGIIVTKIEDPSLTGILNDIMSSESPISVDTMSIPYRTSKDIELFCRLKDSIKFLLIQRRNSLGYLEFMRGHYKLLNKEYITYLFQQMTQDEIDNIKKKDFNKLWKELKGIMPNPKDPEYIKSKEKYTELKYSKDKKFNLDILVNNVKPNWKIPEWGFPKGRRNHKENNIDCAQREFIEETGFNKNDFILLDSINKITEDLIGTNKVPYQHVYYTGLSINPQKIPTVDETNFQQSHEIGNIGWFSYDESLDMIRSYHYDRRNIITQVYLFFLEKIINYHRKLKEELELEKRKKK